MTPIALALIGLALALPVPALLARARWPMRTPVASLIMWQALALAAILAMSGAGLSTALWLVADDQLDGSSPSPGRIAAHIAVLAIGVLVWGRFWWAAWTVWRESAHRRTRHRDLIDLLGQPYGALPAVRIMAAETPVAYCLPRRKDSRVVVSQGTLDALDQSALQAVLEHERTHVRNRHDLLLEGFGVLRKAYPRFLRTDAPLHQSQILVELMADDVARRSVGSAPLARAIVELAGSRAPVGTLGVGGSPSVAMYRLDRLRHGERSCWWATALAAAISIAVLVVPTIAIAVPWMSYAVGEVLG